MGKVVLYLVLLCLLCLFLYWFSGSYLPKQMQKQRRDERTRTKRGGQNQAEQRRRMWDTYSHLHKIWNPLLEKWDQFPIQMREQIPENPIHSLAALKSTCALKVYEGKCDCNKSCNSCGQWSKDKTCAFKCKNSCFSCGQFHKYANWHVQLSESQQLEIDKLAAQKIFANL